MSQGRASVAVTGRDEAGCWQAQGAWMNSGFRGAVAEQGQAAEEAITGRGIAGKQRTQRLVDKKLVQAKWRGTVWELRVEGSVRKGHEGASGSGVMGRVEGGERGG